MRLDSIRRIIVISLLSLLLFGMFVHYGMVAAEPGRDLTRHSHATLRTHDENVGDRLYFWAYVEGASEDTLVVSVASRMVAVRSGGVDADPGDVIQVYGVVASKGEIRAERIVVSKRGNLRYLYAISAVGAFLTIALFYRDWKIHWRTLFVTPREDDHD